jgi:uncharacterized protein (TIGR00369 family)
MTEPLVIPPPRLWEEPVRGGYTPPADFVTKTGLELLQGFFTGVRIPPPIRYLTGMMFTAVEPGKATFTMPVTDWLLAPQGVVSGSTLSLLVDGPLGCTVQTGLPVATPYTTAEMSLAFIRPVLPRSGTLTGVGELIHSGRSISLARVRVTDERDRLIAIADTRCVVLPRAEVPAELPDPAAQVEPEWPTPHPYQRDGAGEVLPPEIWEQKSGLEILRAHIAGELPPPPIAHLCGIHPREADEGRTVWSMPASEWLCSPIQGRVYGGAIAYLMGTALDGTYQSIVGAGTAFAPVDLKVYFLRPVAPNGGDMVATGTIVQRGRSFAVAMSDAVDSNGKRVAVAIGSALLLRGRPPWLATPGEASS